MAGFARRELDVLGFARSGNEAAVQLFAIRDGKTISRDVFQLENLGDGPDEEALSAFLRQYYATAGSIPPRVLVPRRPAGRRGAGGVPAGAPRQHRDPQRAPAGRGQGAHDPRRPRNAAETLAREQAKWLADQGRTLGALEELATALGLPAAPMRIECYDISTIQGTNTVGSMVVFEEGRPRSGDYRRFRIRTVEGTDDFASHREVFRRRFKRALASEEGSAEELRWRLPDLVIIDGGKGQVSAARGVLDELGLHDVPLAGIAKEREELFLPGQSDPIVLPATSQALYLVQRLRDEAHRFAITYHRQLRAKAQTKSALDDLPGVGPARKRALLRVFGSTRALRQATVEEIAAVPGHRGCARGAYPRTSRAMRRIALVRALVGVVAAVLLVAALGVAPGARELARAPSALRPAASPWAAQSVVIVQLRCRGRRGADAGAGRPPPQAVVEARLAALGIAATRHRHPR